MLKIDCHSNVNGRFFKWGVELKKLVEAADKLGIDKLCCSIPSLKACLSRAKKNLAVLIPVRLRDGRGVTGWIRLEILV